MNDITKSFTKQDLAKAAQDFVDSNATVTTCTSTEYYARLGLLIAFVNSLYREELVETVKP